MILTDREIRIAIEQRSIIIDPAPAPSAYSSTSVDLTLDPVVSLFNEPDKALEIAVDPVPGFNPEKLLAQIATRLTIGEDGLRLKPHTLLLAWTAEYIDLRPSVRLAARVEGKSSLARIGLGVHGRIRLEIVNHGKLPIILRPGMKNLPADL